VANAMRSQIYDAARQLDSTHDKTSYFLNKGTPPRRSGLNRGLGDL